MEKVFAWGCAADGDWVATDGGEQAVLPCTETGCSFSRFRKCQELSSGAYAWGDIDDSRCSTCGISKFNSLLLVVKYPCWGGSITARNFYFHIYLCKWEHQYLDFFQKLFMVMRTVAFGCWVEWVPFTKHEKQQTQPTIFLYWSNKNFICVLNNLASYLSMEDSSFTLVTRWKTESAYILSVIWISKYTSWSWW